MKKVGEYKLYVTKIIISVIKRRENIAGKGRNPILLQLFSLCFSKLSTSELLEVWIVL